MSGRVNPAFESTELGMLESGQHMSEPVANQNITSESSNPWMTRCNAIDACFSKHQRVFKIFIYVILNLLIITYIVFAGIYWRNNSSRDNSDLEWCNGYGMLLIIAGVVYGCLFYYLIVKRYLGKYIIQCCKPLANCFECVNNTKYGRHVIKAIVYIIVFVPLIVFLVLDTADSRDRLISCLGIIVIVGMGGIFSKHPGQINWRSVAKGLVLQFTIGLIIIRLPAGRNISQCLSSKVATFLEFAKTGARFVFSDKIVNDGVFAFAVLPVIFFFSFIVQILSYIGAMQWVIMKLGWALQRLMGTTLCESVCAVATPLIGMSESPLLIKSYLNKLTSSELHAIMCSGFSTVAGSVLAAYIMFGAQPAYLITASVMSAPAALCYAKLFYPETEQSLTKFENMKLEKPPDNGILDAATNGALAALPIVLGIIANIVAFVSFVAFVNAILSWFGGLVGHEELSLELILAKTFMPLSWVMGVPWEHCEDVATLIGLKMVVNELIAYQRMGEFKAQGRLYGRSELIATFAICGFANPASIGITIGCLTSLAPEKKDQITAVVLRAFFAGSAVCLLTASIAGVLIKDTTFLPSVTTMVTNVTETTTLHTLSVH